MEQPASELVDLTRRERQIMEAVFAHGGEATANQVLARLPDPPSNTSVRTILRILEQKGHLTHRRRGKENVNRPPRPPGRAARSALRRILETFFGGSLERAVVVYLSDPKAALSAEELERLRGAIERARRKGT